MFKQGFFPHNKLLYANMNQPYRVRIKTKVKVRIAFMILILGIALNFLLKLDFGFKKDEVVYGHAYLLQATEIRSSGSYRGSTSSTYGKFQLPTGKLISAKIYVISHNTFYCVAEVLINGKVNHYQTLKHEKCV